MGSCPNKAPFWDPFDKGAVLVWGTRKKMDPDLESYAHGAQISTQPGWLFKNFEIPFVNKILPSPFKGALLGGSWDVAVRGINKVTIVLSNHNFNQGTCNLTYGVP